MRKGTRTPRRRTRSRSTCTRMITVCSNVGEGFKGSTQCMFETRLSTPIEKLVQHAQQNYSTRGSGADDGQGSRTVLDSSAETPGEKSNQALRWVFKISGPCLLSPASWKSSLTRTQGTSVYQVIGVDYAGPLRYRISKQREGKAYVLLYACSLTRGIYLDMLPKPEMTECLSSLKDVRAKIF